MKVYKRLTYRDGNIVRHIEPIQSSHLSNRIAEEIHKEFELKDRLGELEDKIESGELCDREEVRKETAREILQMLVGHEIRDKEAHMSWVIVKQDVTFIAEKYGIDLFGETEQVGNSDKLEER